MRMNNNVNSTIQNEKVRNLFIFVAIIVSSVSIIFSNSSLLVIAMILTFVSMMIYCIFNLANHIVLAIMFICIFTFLSSSVIVRFLSGQSNFMYGFNNTEFNTACTLIIISYYMIFCGYAIDKRYRIVFGGKRESFFADSCFSIKRIQKITFVLFVGASIVELFFSIPKMLYSRSNGYMALYSEYSGSIWLTRLSFIASSAFFIGLAAKPNKKRFKCYAILGLINPVIVFLQGERSTLVTYVLFLIYYYFTYDNLIYKTNETDSRKTVKLVLLGGISMLIILPFLYRYGLSRIDMLSEAQEGYGITNFFDSQGGSFRVVGAAVKYKGTLPQKWYSFGAIIDRFTDATYYVQNEQRATMAHSFADTITYLEEKWSYLSGYGMGSSYIAEIFYDFGILGVIIVNFFLGRILKCITDFKNLSIFKRSLLFIIFQNIMIMPRGAFLRPLDVLLSSSTIIVYFIVFGFARYRNKGDQCNRLIYEK